MVEDDDDVRLVLTLALREAGWEVDAVASAEEALEATSARPLPDVLVTDQTLPGLTGHQLAAQLRRSHPGLPVLLTSGARQSIPTTLPPPVLRLQKPFRIAELLESVGSLREAVE